VRAVNTSRDCPLKVTVTVMGTPVGARGTLQTITGDSFEAADSFRTPEAITVHERPFPSGGTFTVELPPHWVLVLTLPRNQGRGGDDMRTPFAIVRAG
jgi:alpha-L-arabinofuranosidase